MWVLSTDRAELHFFQSPEEVPDGYAALSHVWNKDNREQSFQDVQRINKDCRRNGTNPRDFVFEKIQRCCELAEKHGYKWVWIDTCCIDKTSSADISEAVTAMFRYYSLARICYGYLADIPYYKTDFPESDDPKVYQDIYCDLIHSQWFHRGWTLQELIAPGFFLFLSQDWKVLGSRSDFAIILEQKFGIPAALLKYQVSHRIYSIAQRMSWFQKRKTTWLEDEAYCLLGLFGIYMPTLYGEGRHAFQRLQEEIMKQSADTTLFAWDFDSVDPHRASLFAPSPSAFYDDAVNFEPMLYKPPGSDQQDNNDTAIVSCICACSIPKF